MEDGAAAAIDGARILAREPADIGLVHFFCGVHVRQALPSLAYAEDALANLGGAVHNRLDHRVEPGHVAASRQDANIGSRNHGHSPRVARLGGASRKRESIATNSDSWRDKAGKTLRWGPASQGAVLRLFWTQSARFR